MRSPRKGAASTRRSLQKSGGHCTHVMVFLILKVTKSCIQKAEPPKMRCRGTWHPCYGVFNIKGHNELHTPFWRSRLFLTKRCIQNAEPPKRGSLHKAEPPKMRWHGTLHPCYGVFEIFHQKFISFGEFVFLPKNGHFFDIFLKKFHFF